MFARAYLTNYLPVPLFKDDHTDLEKGSCHDHDKASRRYNPSITFMIMARTYTVLAILPWLFGLALCVVLDGVAAVAAILGTAFALSAVTLLVISAVVAAPAWGPAAWRWRRAWADSAPPV
nr:hypothetical protein [Pandoravirus aubagnensis]